MREQSLLLCKLFLYFERFIFTGAKTVFQKPFLGQPWLWSLLVECFVEDAQTVAILRCCVALARHEVALVFFIFGRDIDNLLWLSSLWFLGRCWLFTHSCSRCLTFYAGFGLCSWGLLLTGRSFLCSRGFSDDFLCNWLSFGCRSSNWDLFTVGSYSKFFLLNWCCSRGIFWILTVFVGSRRFLLCFYHIEFLK